MPPNLYQRIPFSTLGAESLPFRQKVEAFKNTLEGCQVYRVLVQESLNSRQVLESSYLQRYRDQIFRAEEPSLESALSTLVLDLHCVLESFLVQIRGDGEKLDRPPLNQD